MFWEGHYGLQDLPSRLWLAGPIYCPAAVIIFILFFRDLIVTRDSREDGHSGNSFILLPCPVVNF